MKLRHSTIPAKSSRNRASDGVCRNLYRSLHPVQAELVGTMKLQQSTIPAESGKTELANSDPARPHYGPEDFAWTLRALSGVLKASPGPPRPRPGASSGRNRQEGLTP